MVGPGIDMPLVGAAAQEAALGGDDQSFGIGIEGFGDQLFGDVGAVAIGGVDKVDAQLDGAAEDADGFGLVFGWAPDAVTGDAHGAKAHPADVQVPAEGKIFLEG